MSDRETTTETAAGPTGAVASWEASRRRRGPACLSDRVLDARLRGELPATERSSAEAHLVACLSCSAALTALDDDRRRFLAEADLPTLAADALARAQAAPPRSTGVWWRRWLPVAGLGAAAAAALVLVPRFQRSTEEDFRSKGALSMSLYVKHGEGGAGEAGALHGGEALHPGDRVRLSVASDRPGQLAVLALDTTGRVSVYQAMTQLPATRDQALPGAIELDGTLGAEVIVALRCSEEVSTQMAVDAAQRAVDLALVGRDPGAALGRLGLPCVETRYAIRKTAAGPATPR